MERRILLEGCLNFRDLGGYPASDGQAVRWRRLFRSDALHLVTPADVARLRDELAIGAVVDLRSSAEVHSEGRGPLEREAMQFHHVPLFEGDVSADRERAARWTLVDRYVLMAEFAAEPIGRVISTLARSEAPAIFHCAAGKDRTGVISAILLGLLDVPDEVIVADYVATQENLDAIVDRLMSLEGYKTMLAALPPDTLHAAPETMTAFLHRFRERHGSFASYAREAGVTDQTLAHLRRALLVPA